MNRETANLIVANFWEKGMRHPQLSEALGLLGLTEKVLKGLGRECARVTRAPRRREVLTPSGCGRRT